MLHVGIIEDENLVRNMLVRQIAELRPAWQIDVIPGSIEEGEEWFRNNKAPELIFADIELSDGISFTLLEKMKVNSFIIFTTAYNEYALKAFSVNSIDYLLKPIDKPELLKAIEKFEGLAEAFRTRYTESMYRKDIADTFKKSTQAYRQRFLVATVDSYHIIHTEEVAYFFFKDKVCTLVTFRQEYFTIPFSLEQLEEQLDPESFFRANRQYLLSIHAIRKITPHFNGKLSVTVHPETEDIIISKEKAQNFKTWLNH